MRGLSRIVVVHIDVVVRSYCCQIGCSSAVYIGLLKAIYHATSISLFSHVCVYICRVLFSVRCLCISNPYCMWHLPCTVCNCLSEVIYTVWYEKFGNRNDTLSWKKMYPFVFLHNSWKNKLVWKKISDDMAEGMLVLDV